MGIKRVKKIFDVVCPYCEKKLVKEELIEEGYVDSTPCGDAIYCPNCDSQFLEQK